MDALVEQRPYLCRKVHMKNIDILTVIYIAAGLVIGTMIIIMYFAKSLFKNHTNTLVQITKIESNKENGQTLNKLKLQAYERLSLLLERTSIPALIQNLGGNGLTAREFKLLALKSINDEFNYNLSQQIYVSDQTWGMIKVVKEQTSILLQQVEKTLPENAGSAEFCIALINHLQEQGDVPHEKGLKMIKQEIELIFG